MDAPTSIPLDNKGMGPSICGRAIPTGLLRAYRLPPANLSPPHVLARVVSYTYGRSM